MLKNESLCVVIPVHKPELTIEEEISLKACKRQLHDYDCFLVFPKGMKVDAYLAIYSELRAKPVDPLWLSSVKQYNRMKLSLSFYEKFREFKFMLTYELDAYIFHSNFDQAKVFSYDFIGAPFFQGYLTASPNSHFIQGCNSGFSVRNINTCMQVLQSLNKYRIHWNFYKLFLSKNPRLRFHLNRLTKGRYDIYLNGMLGFYFADHQINEDVIWSRVIPRLFKSFIVADSLNALRFSFEHNPEKLLESNGGELPLGCHAWSKYLNFWEKYIID
jgi:hypothetical protein